MRIDLPGYHTLGFSGLATWLALCEEAMAELNEIKLGRYHLYITVTDKRQRR